ncbi:MAG: (2Fe-2S) ferredoxin domain-containing protein [Mobilicoccus sp.]|nr:(2Fe-2S) ferredoxin domain-containing protein [Mobilicoccus sp.]
MIVAVTLTLTDSALVPDLLTPDTVHAVAGLQGPVEPLTDVLDGLAATGDDVVLVGVSAAPGALPTSWLRRVAGHWLRRSGHAGTPAISIADPVRVTLPVDLDTVADLITRSAAGPTRRVTGTEAELRCPTWEEPPEHRHHVLVCRGPRCSAQGGADVAAALGDLIDEVAHSTLITQTGCLYPCNQAPVVRVHPSGRWFSRLTPDQAPDVVAALGDGAPHPS